MPNSIHSSDQYNILIVAPSWVGDAVLSLPLIQAVMALHPKAVIDVLSSPWTKDVYRRSTFVHDIIESPFAHKSLAWKARRALAHQMLRPKKYRVAYVLPNSLKSSLIPWFANIPIRIGFLGEWRFGFINKIRPRPYQWLVKEHINLPNSPITAKPIKTRWHQAYEYVGLIENLAKQSSQLLIGQGVSDTITALKPFLNANRQEGQRILAALAQAPRLLRVSAIPPIPNHAGWIALCPGAEYGAAKRWPTHRFAELALLAREKGFSLVILGSPKDKDLGDAIEAEIEKKMSHALIQDNKKNSDPQHWIFNLCGQTSLGEAIDIMSFCHAVICNDSGLMHIAAALHPPPVTLNKKNITPNAPQVIAIFGASDAGRTAPLSYQPNKITVLEDDTEPKLSCRPCLQRECRFGHYLCLEHISAERVLRCVVEA